MVFGLLAIAPQDAHAVKLGTRIKATFGNKDAKKEVAQHKATKQAAKAEKACAKGKARKCERLKRKAAANQYAAETGDFKGKRQMKRRDRKLRRAKKACRKGKQKKCDRLTRKAAKHDCLLNGNSRKDCRKQKRRDRKAQRAYRKGFSDENVTAGLMDKLNNTQKDQRNNLLGAAAAGGVAAAPFASHFTNTRPGAVVQPMQLEQHQVDNGFDARLMQLRQQKAMACESRGGSWTGTSCIEGRVPASAGFGGGPGFAGRIAPIAAPVQYQGNQLMQQRGFGSAPAYNHAPAQAVAQPYNDEAVPVEEGYAEEEYYEGE